MIYINCCILVIIILYYLYHYIIINRHFKSTGLKFLKGVPIFGNKLWSTFATKHALEDLKVAYDAFPQERYIGFTDGIIPIIVIRDPELMKSIVVKDFDHFIDRKKFFPERLDPLLGKNIINAHGDHWKRLRTNLTSAFTASKLKYMMSIMVEVSENIVEKLKSSPQLQNDIEIGEITIKYSIDATACSAFGFEQKMTDELTRQCLHIYFNFGRRLLYFISIQNPMLGNILQYFGFQLFPKECTKFFRETVQNLVEYRKKHKIVRQDYLQVIMDYCKDWSLDEIAGQTLFSFIAGFDTGGSIISLCFHELALHPDIQERLYQEIRTHQVMEGRLTYDNLGSLKYLNCVLNETERKWSASMIMDRICTKDYTLPPPREGGRPYVVKPGDLVYNLINAVQSDPKYHPNQEAFEPDRFSDENKHAIRPFTFTPFGMGPRNCIAARYMGIQMKVLIYSVVLNFKILRCSKTIEPIRIQPSEFTVKAVGGSWVRLVPRN